ncbi:uncharacterized protein [Melopsittacus undulatus]|uniref:uncharacterized protein isoform X2 n=1 Tax=Melopsittacus undulatus TaxID=13146 RepID=UPI00146F4BD4|nr:uncharacterized protein LOC115945638 isoform X2 [Melopsittacus undulatus]
MGVLHGNELWGTLNTPLGLWAVPCGWSPMTHSPAWHTAPLGVCALLAFPTVRGFLIAPGRENPSNPPPPTLWEWPPACEGGGCQECVWQEPLTFEDIAVYMSRTEWDAITAGQRELYCSVMMDNYGLLTSLGYTGPKPDILYRMERGEEPWVCSPQSPPRWKGPDCLSPGCAEAMRLLKAPPWGWWPGADAPEERAQSPCQEPQPDRRQTPTSTCSDGGQSLQCNLQPGTLLNKLRCLMDHSNVEVANREVAPARSENYAQTVVWPKQEETAENKHGVTANLAQGRELTLNSWMEQQNHESYPQEHLYVDPKEEYQRSTSESFCPSGEAPFLLGPRELCAKDVKEAIWKDHCYCRVSMIQIWHRGSWPCPPTDHSYCQLQVPGITVLKDHAYCLPQRSCFRARVGNMARLGGKAWVVLRRLAAQRAQIRRIIRKAKQIMWRCNSQISRRLRVPRRASSTGSTVPAVADGKVESVPLVARCESLGSPAECEDMLPLSESRISSQEALCTPVASPAPLPVPPPSEAAAVVSSEVLHPEVSAHSTEEPICSSDVNQSTKEQDPAHSKRILIQATYKTWTLTVDNTHGSVCYKMQLNSYSWHVPTWPSVIRIDS